MPAIQTGDWVAASPLAIGTYHFGFGGEASLVQSFSAFWDTVTVGTITFWTSDYPIIRVAANDVVAGHWIQQQPPTALGGYTAISPAGAATLGASPLLITIPGAVAGGINVQLGNVGSRHIKALVTIATAGAFTYCFHGKD